MTAQAKIARVENMIESPRTILDQDGIVIVDYGTMMITLELLKEALDQHRELAPMKKSKVLAIGEAGAKIDTELAKFGATDEVIALTSAVAIVPRTKVGWAMGKLFLTLQKNPYPTRIFNSVDAARGWLLAIDPD
ncbi:MAG: hypothetical protein HOA08_18585 [Rhodospirillaceae bacterium]|nr:hypothetical protein [Rhodospirillaceae bacterium]MBT3491517.1 hypothetical protein [Rhodospirillaceae bacterium]MBT3778464.1 hypothetical protein [Rhodospirillaceae bacterium]MBT3976055.1 hypothetical protein [Rhodospirillaceae bacterium]MBT4169972.1 hypothetical protein [Rhodospirillaceae bacterium]